MNAQELIQALKPLEGHTILIHYNNTIKPPATCLEVRALPPAERQEDQGNVILFNGIFGQDGALSGYTIQASEVDTATWQSNSIQLESHKRILTITKMYPLKRDDHQTPPLTNEIIRRIADNGRN